MRTYKISLVILISLIGSNVFSQNDSTFWNSNMADIAMPTSSPGWIQIKEDRHFTPENFFDENKEAFQLKENDNMELIKSGSDNLGFTHYRYQQTYKGVKAEGCEYILHAQNGYVVSANGKLAPDLDKDITPAMDERTALDIILKNVNATKYGWEAEKNEDGELYSQYPKGELLIARILNNKDFTNGNFKLAYRFEIATVEPVFSKAAIYLDAKTGEIIKKENLLINCSCCSGSTNTLYHGSRNIKTKEQYGYYFLLDNCRGGGIQTYYNNSDVLDNYNTFKDSHVQRVAGSAHWAAEMTYDYFLNTFQRNSFDSLGAKINLYTGVVRDNAYWDGNDLHFGYGDTQASNDLVSLDVVGHEFTHAVTQYAAKLTFSSESGALNESFSDIFGTMVEYYGLNGAGDYLLGEDFWIADGKMRDMSNPNSKGQPDTYGGDYWFNVVGCVPVCDGLDPNYNNCCGVHTNSGVQNFWFYLLSEGGTGTNDNNYAYSVSGIGREKAAAIAYHNLTLFLTSASEYADARNGSIFAAIDLYGHCSNEVMQTVNAWNAVGVFSSYSFGGDVAVNCTELNTVHATSPYTVKANNITANCAITPSNGQPVTFMAANSITLNDGFESGDNFLAYTFPCSSGNNQRQSAIAMEENKTSLDNEENIERENNSFLIFPNPSKGQFTLITSLKEQETISIFIRDIIGQLIYEKNNLSTNTFEFDLSAHSQGIYFLNIIRGGKVYTEKIVLY